ncbi:MAG TPA: CPBP family intramembrane glutamic endopeptidase [Saprospiraceae bacterium]|nr:CPBP family intramembrane glutamic endopeptidase [Saprospiraceae bacterium]
MEYTFAWPEASAEANITIILVTIGFIVFWFTGKSDKLLTKQIQAYGPEDGQQRHVFIKRIVGMATFGLIPGLVLLAGMGFSWSDYGVKPSLDVVSLYWILGLSAIIIPMTFRSTRAADNLAQYPEIRRANWSPKLVVLSALSWMGYLVAYELMFRGFLLFSCVRAFGVWPAIIINTSIYALVHVPKNAKEGIGAIPLGLLLCVLTLQTQTIWIALIVHWVLSLANEWFSLKYHPDMQVVK